MWLLRWIGRIVCPIIVCDVNNCNGVVIGVYGQLVLLIL